MSRIYVCRCSAKKNEALRGAVHKDGTSVLAKPTRLYTGKTIQNFMHNCEEANVPWAIFSDKWGIVFSHEEIPWYDRHPDDVTMRSFKWLLGNFDDRLEDYDEILFFYEPSDWHILWDALLEMTARPVRTFTDLTTIG